MASLSQSSEAEFREHFLEFLIVQKGYPKGLITKELPLSFLAGMKGKRRDRRADLLVFTPGSCAPLLLIECKKNPPKQSAIYQLLGYNLHVKAPFSALVWPEGFLWYGTASLSGDLLSFPEYKPEFWV